MGKTRRPSERPSVFLGRGQQAAGNLVSPALSTTAGMAGTILNTLNRDLELSFIDQYPARVGALTKAQVNGAIKKHLDPEKMVLVKAGTVPGAK